MARWYGVWAAASVVGAGLLRSGVAHADPPCQPKGPWVIATIPQGQPGGFDARAVVDRLGIELSGREITLCTQLPDVMARPALATVTLALDPSGGESGRASVKLDIEVRDAVTAKRVGRTINLAGVPPDGRSTVVALAADELLRASWAELALERAPPPAVPLPPEVRRAIEPPRPEPGSALVSIGLRGTAEWWTGGLAFFGADGTLSWTLHRRLRIELLAGARASPGAEAPNGTIEARALTGRVGATWHVTERVAGPSLGIGARGGIYLLRLEGDPDEGASGAAATSFAISLELGPVMRVPVGGRDSAVVLDAFFAVAPRGVGAGDGGAHVTGLAGVAGMVSVGLAAGVL